MIRDSISGPRWLDDARAASVSERTLRSYQRSAAEFVAYLEEHSWFPEEVEEWDDLLVEFSHEAHVKHSRVREVYASLEFFFPRMRGKLAWSRSRLDVMSAAVAVRHTVPAGREVCLLLGARISSMGRPRIGLGMLVQHCLGLRPGELVRLTPEDVAESPSRDQKGLFIFRLGTGRGTKSGREQFALLRRHQCPDVLALVQLLIAHTLPGQRLFPYTVGTYSTWVQKAQVAEELPLGVTAHSPRAGFASDAIASGTPAFEVKEAGRWVSEASFRTYVDLVGSQAVAQQLRLKDRAAVVAWIDAHLADYFPAWALAQHARAPGIDAGGSRNAAPGQPPLGGGRGGSSRRGRGERGGGGGRSTTAAVAGSGGSRAQGPPRSRGRAAGRGSGADGAGHRQGRGSAA